MKKIILAVSLFTASVSFSSAACTNITGNVTRGMQSSNVLVLQQFLAGKGYLKATPNGYFGPATLAAAKLYQKSAGLPQTGAVLGMTRAAIAKESCQSEGVTTNTTTTTSVSSVSTTHTAPISVPVVVPNTPSIIYPRPNVTHMETGTLFARASTTWNTLLRGWSFSTTTNTVYFKSLLDNRTYTIGTFPAENNASITLPDSLTNRIYSCGYSCNATLPAGDYDVTVLTEGGESAPVRASIKTFAVSASSGSPYASVKQMGTSTKLGVVTFSASVPYYISELQVNVAAEGLSNGSGLTNVVLRDEITKEAVPTGESSPTFGANQTKIIGIYGDIDSWTSGYINGTLSITINDFIGKKPVTFTSPGFSVTVSGI